MRPITVNGRPIEATQSRERSTSFGGQWEAGDTIELSLPMPVRMIEAHPFVEEARNQVAVVRGPIVYCLESIDLPANIRLLDVLLPRAAKICIGANRRACFPA